jgi:hypothetical protein
MKTAGMCPCNQPDTREWREWSDNPSVACGQKRRVMTASMRPCDQSDIREWSDNLS